MKSLLALVFLFAAASFASAQGRYYAQDYPEPAIPAWNSMYIYRGLDGYGNPVTPMYGSGSRWSRPHGGALTWTRGYYGGYRHGVHPGTSFPMFR
jgi:hypothetical protein